MRPRTLQLACMLLLLCAFGGVDAAARSVGQVCTDCASLQMLLRQVATTSAHHATPAATSAAQPAAPLATPARQALPTAMTPPAAHSAQQQAVTASGL